MIQHKVFGGGDGVLVSIVDVYGVIHPNVQETLDAREALELDQAIAMSLAECDSRSEGGFSLPSPRLLAQTKAPPPRLARSDSLYGPRPPSAEVPSPPPAEPTLSQRIAAHARIANLPTLFPPTGNAWMSSPLAQPKAPPPALPPIREDPPSERWFYFPTQPHVDLLSRRFGGNLPTSSSSVTDSESDFSEGDDHDATSTHSTAPSLGEQWD